MAAPSRRVTAAIVPAAPADTAWMPSGSWSQGLAPARMGSAYGYIDTAGRVAVTPRFSHALPFSGGLAPVLLDGRWGYVDSAGELAVPAAFDWAGPFSEGRAAVADSGGYRFIDTAGNPIGRSAFSDARPFSGGLAAVRFGDGEDAVWGFIDTAGRLAIPPLFADVPRGFSEGYAAVTVGSEAGRRMGYIDTSGGFAMDSLFDAAGDFSGGLAPVGRGETGAGRFRGTWHYVDSSGARALPGDFAWAGSFRGDTALVKRMDGTFALLARDGSSGPPLPDSAVSPPRWQSGIVTYELRNARADAPSRGRLAGSK